MKTYIHIGVDKCGSSSLQRYLSINGQFLNNKNRLIEYKCLTKNGILTSDKIKFLVNKKNKDYLSSMGLKDILNYEENYFYSLFKKNKVIISDESDQIYSCEGWYRGLKKIEFFNRISNGFKSSTYNKLIFIAFLRSPVLWINSAWWQWGAWESHNKNSFDRWLQRVIKNVNWYDHFKNFDSFKKNHQLILKPIREDILKDFSSLLEFKGKINYPGRLNRGLPPEILKLYLDYPRVRFIMKKIFNKKKLTSNKTPWVLNKSNIRLIVKNTYKSNIKLLEILNKEDKEYIENDPSWWDENYYKDIKTYNPFLEDFNLDKNKIRFILKNIFSGK